jgi:LacI family transcriptional regulator
MMQLNEWGFMDGIESVFTENDLRLMLVRLPTDGTLPSVLSQNDCDGLLILADLADIPAKSLDCLASFPSIQMIHGNARQQFGDEVFCDNQSVAKLAHEYLTQIGTKRYAFYNAHPEHHACHERQMFFDFYCQQAGMSVTHLVADQSDATTQPGHVLANALVKQMKALDQLPDGLFVPVDFQLPELYTALKSHGIEPMRDLQIISCDNCERHLVKTAPRPVTIDLRMHDLGRYAARQMIWRIEHPDSAPARLYIKPELIYP